jgi:hypothetical protein
MSTTTSSPSAVIAVTEPTFTNTERLALAGFRRTQSEAAQLVHRVPAAAHNDRRSGRRLFRAQRFPLLNPRP